ncbi:hypothetical protein VB264_23650 [Arcicella aquatica]|uniref:Phosphodiester glycosidase domain-containing protein n=1 Tax=Arcicella aquatica TaxID=217141 RepID=A0ABU5QVS2_9BACT|nr:hypothetical protein [Arcicella aquatica]MEA5260815.1 hypothetical protein [Arcicella aquatica]
MKRILMVLILTLFLTPTITANIVKVEQYLQNNTNDKTLNKFPYKQYVKNFNFKMFKDDLMLLKTKNITDFIFIENTLTLYFKSVEKKSSIDFLTENYKISEAFYNIYKSDSIRYFSFGIVQNVILSDISSKLQNEINKKTINPNNEDVDKLINNLSIQHYSIHVKKNIFEKTWYHFRHGNFNYILRKAFSAYLKETLLIILLVLILITILNFTFYFIKKRINMNALKIFKKVFVLVFIYFFLSSNISIDNTFTDTSNNKVLNILDETFIDSFHHGEVNIYKLKQNYEDYGQVVWLNRSLTKRIKVKYFASGDAYTKYLDWKKSATTNKIILVCSGAYSTAFKKSDNSTPVGLTVDNGVIVNRSLQLQMDGLAIIYATGGIAVSNIEEKNLNVGSPLNKTIDLNNIFHRIEFLDWCVNEDATIFQTHLLGWKNYLNFNKTDADKANNRIVSRRLFALVKDKISGNVQYVIFNITKDVKLWDASNEALSYIKNQRNMEVIALLNLDTGALDCLSTFDENGYELGYIKGNENKNFSETTNLIVFYRE